MKEYCPYCNLELDGFTHKNNLEAWECYNCEYDSRVDERKPVSEIEYNKQRLKWLKAERKRINSAIRHIKSRNEEFLPN